MAWNLCKLSEADSFSVSNTANHSQPTGWEALGFYQPYVITVLSIDTVGQVVYIFFLFSFCFSFEYIIVAVSYTDFFAGSFSLFLDG